MSAPTNHAFAPVHVKSPLHVAVPSDVDLDDVLADISTDGVSAPADDVAGLTTVVTDARERGVDLSVVVVDANPGRPSDLRDLATTVGKTEGGTVLVLSPDWMGSYSDSISRVQLETAQDRSFGESASVTADRFSHEIVAPGPPWTLYTVLVIAVVAVIAGITFAVKWRREPENAQTRHIASTSETPAPSDHRADSV
ncbi:MULTISPECIES: Rv1476 family membrane protein [Rhodococcus]|uniref:Rv1476 family membrane protein n=1 Tax=Rhodococcus TaxID=1827 RepID=UPI001247441B|nr:MULTISPECIES: DUF6676 family protein [Rhodococcus]MCJ0946166.1 hypothetical protein [Rhodococcus sp. ARC_M8]QEX11432.1 hypothetical protein F6X56_17735 [Rhodococcus erythropolis]UKO89388.1 hypothetical protein ITJ47_16935 [Rhodococcus erythropolis]ULD40955.1 hypothetical protein JKI97_26150 [Rhodococcus qingshengii]